MLTKDSNKKFFTQFGASRNAHLPPTLYMAATGRYARTTIEWDDEVEDWYEVPLDQSIRTELDVRLEMGYQFYLDACCKKCGVPYWYGHSEDNRIEFKVEESVCYSCARLDAETEARNKSKSGMSGVTLIVVPTGTEYEDGSRDPLISPYEAMVSAK